MYHIKCLREAKMRNCSVNKLLLILGAKREDVYSEHLTKKCKGPGTIWNRYEPWELKEKAHDLYRKAAWRHRENEKMLKMLNIAYDRICNILRHHGCT